MEIKGEKSVHVDFNGRKQILIEQWSDELNKPVTVSLSLDQIHKIANRAVFELAWGKKWGQNETHS
jgi:hypothetical protein